MKILRITTRQSPLALKQADTVKRLLEKLYPKLRIELIPLTTQGDQMLNHSLSAVGGKGLFIKELEQALLEDRADIAVHSMKDMPVQITRGLQIAVYLEREDPRDALVSPHYQTLSELPANSKIGTASLRRQGMVRFHRPDLNTELLRGNVNTRLSKLDDGNYDAIILAVAGLNRLGYSHRIQHYFSPEESLPAISQGVMGIQCRSQDKHIKKIILPLDHYTTRLCCLTERLFNQALEGSCHSPIGGYATLHDSKIHLRGCVYSLEKSLRLKAENTFPYQPSTLEQNIKLITQQLIDQGAKELL